MISDNLFLLLTFFSSIKISTRPKCI